ncbi:MAG: glutamyl-tRNA amidotransferase [Actinobacteria bacterium HGW-Actinobacteria-1]|jgi:hypothetical protein|nr:MAG: glutamyl-tRNA amidotransferase [Actinobacteria bacterium HGW-Actinobacteria-1]
MDKALITSEITKAMREHDKIRIGILRLVKNEIDTREKESHQELTDEEVVSAFKKVLKQTGETLEGSIKAGTNAERTELLQQQVDILEGYLPRQVAGDELVALVDRVLAAGEFAGKRDMGKVIGLVVSETGGNCDKAEVAKIVGSKLN